MEHLHHTLPAGHRLDTSGLEQTGACERSLVKGAQGG